MAELSFGEKLLIARKQLDLYQYEMAERLGVHRQLADQVRAGRGQAARGGGADVRAAVRASTASALTSMKLRAKDKGEKMKIVLAEKVSPATLAVFAAEPGWEVLTHDQLPDGFAGGAGRCRCAGGALRGAGGRRADGARAQAARDWPGRAWAWTTSMPMRPRGAALW